MVGNCMDCRKREEDMYWSHFQTVQFCQFLSGRFDQQLAIPKKFADRLREKLAGTITLVGPSGHVWEVGLVTNGDTLLFKHGWKSFVEDHSLEESDILIFKYSGNSRFDVLMFDQESFCEKAGSYFVKKCDHAESGRGSKRTINVVEEGSKDTTSESSSDDIADDHRAKRRRVHEAPRTPPSRIQPNRSTSNSRRRGKKGRRSLSGGYPLQLKSRRREVTEEEINKAQQTAAEAAALSDDSFVVVMRASHVYKGFFMSIPSDWAKAHLPKKSQHMALRLNDNIWPAKYHFRGYGGGLCNGWKKFVLDNYLEEFDVCVFDIASGTHETCTLDVKIFRVVEEVIPPAPVTQATGRKRLVGFFGPSSEDDA